VCRPASDSSWGQGVSAVRNPLLISSSDQQEELLYHDLAGAPAHVLDVPPLFSRLAVVVVAEVRCWINKAKTNAAACSHCVATAARNRVLAPERSSYPPDAEIPSTQTLKDPSHCVSDDFSSIFLVIITALPQKHKHLHLRSTVVWQTATWSDCPRTTTPQTDGRATYKSTTTDRPTPPRTNQSKKSTKQPATTAQARLKVTATLASF